MLKSKTILNIHWGFLPGGVAVYARHIEKVGSYAPLRVRSICINGAGWSFDETNAARMDMDVVAIKGRTDLSWIPKVRAAIKGKSPDLILSHGFNGAFVSVVAGRGIPLVSSWHGDYYPSTLVQKMRKPFVDLSVRILFGHCVRRIVTVSDFSKKALMCYGVKGESISVVHNGISPEPLAQDRREQIRKELELPDGCLLVGTACRLAAPKGLKWFLHAIARIVRFRKDIRFVVWGEGEQRDYLQDQIKKLEIGDYISLPGYRSDIADCLSALDIFVMSSYMEHFSIALLEAMRAGLPIVATDAGGNPEAIDNGCEGILVPVADPDALAEGIDVLSSDPARRKEMARRARQRFLNDFTSDKMVEKTAQWLMECAGRYGSSKG